MKADGLEKSIRRVPLETLILGVISGAAAFFLFEPAAGVLILAGAILSSLGFISVKSFVDRYLYSKSDRLRRRALLFYAVRLLLICLIFLIIIIFFKTRILALAAGFSLIVISILLEVVRNLASLKLWKA